MDKLKAILSIKMALAFRNPTENALEAVLQIFAGIVIAVALIAGTFWLGDSYRSAPAEYAGHYFPGILWIIALVWLSVPLSPYALQRNLHFDGLALLPVTRSQFVGALVINALVSYMGVFVPLITILAIAAFGKSPAHSIWAALVILVFWSGLLISGQLIVLTFGRVLTSRRFMDIAVIVGTLLAFSFYFVRFFFISDSIHAGDFSSIADKWKPVTNVLLYFPPGVAGWSFNAFAAGDFFAAASTFGLLALQTTVLILIAGYAVEKFFLGELSVGGTVKQPVSRGVGKAGAARAPGIAVMESLARTLGFSHASSGLYVKEWRYLFREPVYKLRLINSLMMFAYFLVFFLVFGKNVGFGDGMPAATYILPILTYLTVLGDLRIAANKFGMDGEAVTCLFISPVRREEILFAKSLFGIIVLQSLNAVIVIGGGLLLKVEPVLLILCVASIFSAALVVEAWGNVLSVYFPYKIISTSGRRGQPQFETGGCMFQFAYMIANIATNFVAAPLMGIIIVPYFFGIAPLGFILIPVSAFAAYAIFTASIKLAADKLAIRELAIIELMEKQTS